MPNLHPRPSPPREGMAGAQSPAEPAPELRCHGISLGSDRAPSQQPDTAAPHERRSGAPGPRPDTHRPAASAQVLDGSCRSLQDGWGLALLQKRNVYPHHFWLEQELVACQRTQAGRTY